MKRGSSSGFTLLELLVAFIFFLLMIFALVSLTTFTLESWNYGEEQKDAFDRGQALLSVVEEDLRNLFAERQVVYVGTEENRRAVLGAHMLCDLDKNGRQAFRFVRLSSRDETRVRPPPVSRRAHPVDMYADLFEVVYVMDDDPRKNILWRGVRYFDRLDDRNSFLAAAKFDRSAMQPLEAGILHIEFRFWDPSTTRWDAQGSAPSGVIPVNAGLLWDSSRTRVPKFPYYQKRQDPDTPDFVYPEMVQVVAVLKPQAFTDRKCLLADDMDDTVMLARLNTTRDIPEPPGMIRIDGEWMEYRAKEPSSLTLSKRGARGSGVAAHRMAAEVEFGYAVTRTIYLPTRQEAVGR
jgi:hypothetical protein